MNQVTVAKLLMELNILYSKGMGNKKIVIADDSEGNGFHGIYYTCTSDPNEVKELIESGNGLYDSQTEDYNDIVIIG